MKLQFLGAAKEVTGSCYLLTFSGHQLLIDCGMIQGGEISNDDPFPFDPTAIDYLLLTHAHIDHSGRIPLLVKRGFRGRIITTGATRDLCRIMLRDSAHIQEFEAEWRSRKGRRSGLDNFQPLYTIPDADAALALFEGYDYGKRIVLSDALAVRFTDVGHLLGSASIEVWVREGEICRKLVFSGDIGNTGIPLLKDPAYVTEGDVVITESTYGDRHHRRPPDYAQALAEILQRTFDRGGNLIIPAFAVGRTQELLYFLRQIKQKRMVTGHDGFTVYVDSPLAIEATGIFGRNTAGYYDNEAMALVQQGINPIEFEGLTPTVTAEESRAINTDSRPHVVLSASGMCDAGRIRHHLKHNLWRRESLVLFVGYQAEGTLGRRILEGATVVKIFGEEIDVKAEIIPLEGISGHADQEGLLRWADAFLEPPRQIFVCHGDADVCESYAALLRDSRRLPALAPNRGAAFDLASYTLIDPGTPPEKRRVSGARRASIAYGRLQSAGEYLLEVIRQNEGAPNKDLLKFAEQISTLAQKWRRD